ncbi:MAG: SDR family oxidoreductase [Acidimicrobiales bacterium]|nr:SDR family oxidoreductase [Acidimicrobiales bacterium]
MDRVRDKVVVVTGAASGLGLAESRRLVAEGARVVMTDIDVEAGIAHAAELGGLFVAHDVADEHAWDALTAFVADRFGRLDGLVNNAGVAPIGDIEHTTTEMWRRTLAVHLDGTFFGCRSAIGLMKATGGSIVNTSSTTALNGYAPYLAYSAAKGGIRSLTKSVAAHCRHRGLGIRCNSIHPGSIDTPMVRSALRDLMGVDLAAADDLPATRARLGIGEPDDVAHLVVYLLSDESKHLNGAEFVIDGGETVIA